MGLLPCMPTVLQSNSTVQQKLGVVALPYTLIFMFMVIVVGVGVRVDPVVGVGPRIDIGDNFNIFIKLMFPQPISDTAFVFFFM